MGSRDKLTESFLQAINVVDEIFLSISFKPCSFVERGFAYFIRYKREGCNVEFIYGPPEYQVEMIIYTLKSKFELKDLLKYPAIALWVNNNRYRQVDDRDIKNEMLWFVELLKFSLSIIE